MTNYLRVEGKWFGVLYANTFEVSDAEDARNRLAEWLYRFKQQFGDEPDECTLQVYLYQDNNSGAGSEDNQ